MKRPIPENLNAHPSVFAVEDRYEIITPFSASAVVWVKVGDKKYYDDSNGILKSGNYVHKVEVPMSELDREGEYTLCYRKMIDRKPYFPESEEPRELDSYSLQSTVAIVGGQPDFEKKTYEGCAITLSEKEPEIVFTKNC